MFRDGAADAVYFDESIQDSHGFILGSYVFCRAEDADLSVASALQTSGLRPGIDEFKSRLPFDSNERLRDLRDRLVAFVSRNCQVGFVIAPRSERETLGQYALHGLARIVWRNELSNRDLAVYLDQGVFRSISDGNRLVATIAFPDGFKFHLEQDSRTVFGLQLSDLVANAGARILVETLTGHPRTVLLGESSGYVEGTEASLSWVLKMMLRYSFLCGRLSEPPRDPDGKIMWNLPLMDLRSYAVYTAPGLCAKLEDAIEQAFGTVWLGCIH